MRTPPLEAMTVLVANAVLVIIIPEDYWHVVPQTTVALCHHCTSYLSQISDCQWLNSKHWLLQIWVIQIELCCWISWSVKTSFVKMMDLFAWTTFQPSQPISAYSPSQNTIESAETGQLNDQPNKIVAESSICGLYIKQRFTSLFIQPIFEGVFGLRNEVVNFLAPLFLFGMWNGMSLIHRHSISHKLIISICKTFLVHF